MRQLWPHEARPQEGPALWPGDALQAQLSLRVLQEYLMSIIRKIAGVGLIGWCADCTCRSRAKVDHTRSGCPQCNCLGFRKMK